MASFLGEVKRRRVFQVAAVYAVVAWLLVQIVSTIEEPLNLPFWFDTTVIVLLAVGFPLALVLSWAFDLTAKGIVRSQATETIVDPGVAARADKQSAVPAATREVLPNSVAVLPFENLSPNSEDAYFAAGIHEEILNQLARLRDLNVIARTSVMQYAGAARPIREIADELNVGAVVEGSVRYAGKRVRVTAQLIDGKTGMHRWTEAYDRDLANIFAIQTDIATHIASELNATLTASERENLTEHPTNSTEAYRLYLKTMADVEAPDPTGLPSLRATAQSRLDRALELDENFAAAHARKAELFLSSRQNDPVPPGAWPNHRSELDRLIVEHAGRALELEPSLGYAYTVLGALHLYAWRSAEAGKAFASAVALGPNDARVRYWYGAFECCHDRFDAAADLLTRASELDPNSPLIAAELSYNLWQSGQIDAAEDAIRRCLQLDPGGIWQLFLAGFELACGREDKALEATRAADKLMPREASPGIRAHTGWFYGRLGEHADAQRIFDEISATAKLRYVDPASWAWAHIGIGDYDRALDLYTEVRRDVSVVQDPWVIHLARQNFCSDPILDEPRFQTALSGMWVM